jgi:hypothetical protein
MRFSMMQGWTLLFVLCAAVAACGRIGPDSIEESRLRYNEAVHDTGAEQLLMNIARIHRNELPLSTLVTQIIASVSPGITAGAGIAGLGIGKKGGAFRTGSITSGTLSAGLSYAEPTSVQYQPISGASLVAQLTTPVSVSLIGNLLDSSWPLLNVLQMTTAGLTAPGQSYGMALDAMAELYDVTALDIVPTATSEAAADQFPTQANPTIASALDKIANGLKPAAGVNALTLYFRPPKGDCIGHLRAVQLWSRLLHVYSGTQDNIQRSAVATLDADIKAVDCNNPSAVEKHFTTIDNDMCDLTQIELRTKPLAKPKSGGTPPARTACGNKPSLRPANAAKDRANDWTGRLVQSLSAYAILKSAEKSDYTPSELIDVVPAGFYQYIKNEPWNSAQQLYTFLSNDICSAYYVGPGQGNGFDTLRCRNLMESDKVTVDDDMAPTQPTPINTTVDLAICRHGSERDMTKAAQRIQVYCGKLIAQAPEAGKTRCTEAHAAIFMVDCPKDPAVPNDADAEDNLNQRRRLILVQYSDTAPENPFKQIYKDGYFYFIAGDDFISQKNFALLAIIEDVQAVAPAGPIGTTIPVGQ